MRRRILLRALPDGNTPPTEFLIFAPGVNETEKGPVVFDAESARMVMADYAARGVDLMIDLNHDSLDVPVRPDSGDARGWFQLQLRPDGSLWAVNVRWTPDGARRLAEKTQRYISPAFYGDGRVEQLINVAICAMPATHDARPLVAATRVSLARRNTRGTVHTNSMDPDQVKAALDALQAGDDAKATEILKALIAQAASGGAAPDSSADNEPPADPTAESADGAPPNAGPPAKDAPPSKDPKQMSLAETLAAVRFEREEMAKTLTAMRTELSALNAERRVSEDARRIQLVGELVKLGAETPATAWSGNPEKKVPCTRLAAEPIADLAKRVDMLRAGRPQETEIEPPETGAIDVSQLTPRQLSLCKRAGITPEEFIQRRANAVRRYEPTTENE